jgi:DNA-binding response OmpR family regulator
MPEMNGFEATQAILAQLCERAPPIIACSALVLGLDKQACLDAGMVDHIAKPMNRERLVETLLRWIPPVDARPADSTLATSPATRPSDSTGRLDLSDSTWATQPERLNLSDKPRESSGNSGQSAGVIDGLLGIKLCRLKRAADQFAGDAQRGQFVVQFA